MITCKKEFELVNNLLADPEFKTITTWNQNLNSFDLNYPTETNHSSMISWLLNPRESHGLGSLALQGLLNACWVAVNDSDSLATFFETYMGPIAFERLNFSSAILFEELNLGDSGRLDILVILPDDNVAIVIENKYGASETPGQLDRYHDWAKNKLTDYNVLYVHMDAYERWSKKSTSDEWVDISYDWVMSILEHSIQNPATNDRLRFLLQDYHNYLGEDLLQNDPHFGPLNEVLSSFAYRHSEAIEVIRKHNLYDFSFERYISSVKGSWVEASRLVQILMENSHAFSLLLACQKFDLLEECILNSSEGFKIEHSDRYFRLYSKHWDKLKIDQDGLWPIYLDLMTVKKSAEDDDNEVLALKLIIAYDNLADDQLHNLEKICHHVAGEKKLNKKESSKYKTFWLERELDDNNDFLKNQLLKYVTKINNCF